MVTDELVLEAGRASKLNAAQVGRTTSVTPGGGEDNKKGSHDEWVLLLMVSQILGMAAAVEVGSEHPIGQAILRYYAPPPHPH